MDLRFHHNGRENLLVKLFRSYQVLYCLLQDEREALSNSDFQQLSRLLERIKNRCEIIDRLVMEMDAWPSEYNGRLQPGCGQGDLRVNLPEQIDAGVKALLDVIQEMAAANQSMALAARQRIEVTRNLLISHDGWPYTSDPSVQSPGLENVLQYLRSHENILNAVLECNQHLAATPSID